ncbi:MAG TPA: hypothetical protein VEH81_04055 [Ktedonobacteraceae bacterium]|nr:hypothetical protein [Ktedonobacteraceae bacterium]
MIISLRSDGPILFEGVREGGLKDLHHVAGRGNGVAFIGRHLSGHLNLNKGPSEVER